MGHYESDKAKCPMYKSHHPQMIYCHGVVPETVIHLAFARRDTALAYRHEQCYADYRACPIYQMLVGVGKNGA